MPTNCKECGEWVEILVTHRCKTPDRITRLEAVVEKARDIVNYAYPDENLGIYITNEQHEALEQALKAL